MTLRGSWSLGKVFSFQIGEYLSVFLITVRELLTLKVPARIYLIRHSWVGVAIANYSNGNSQYLNKATFHLQCNQNIRDTWGLPHYISFSVQEGSYGSSLCPTRTIRGNVCPSDMLRGSLYHLKHIPQPYPRLSQLHPPLCNTPPCFFPTVLKSFWGLKIAYQWYSSNTGAPLPKSSFSCQTFIWKSHWKKRKFWCANKGWVSW